MVQLQRRMAGRPGRQILFAPLFRGPEWRAREEDRRGWLAERLLAWIAAVLIGVISPACVAQERRPHTVLVLLPSQSGMPTVTSIMAGIRTGIAGSFADPVSIYVEHVDATRFGMGDYLPKLEAWLTQKYQSHSLDLIVAAAPAALAFAIKARRQHWAGIPIVFCSVPPPGGLTLPLPPKVTGLWFELDAKGTLAAALALFPDTRKVVLVGGASRNDQYFNYIFANAVLSANRQLELVDLSALGFWDILQRTQELSPDTIILGSNFEVDAEGSAYFGPDALATATRTANRPIFTVSQTVLGLGIVGGSLTNFEEIGLRTGQMARRVLRGELPADAPPVRIDVNRLMFDWRQLKRWNVPEDFVPPGSEIRFRELTLWQAHRSQVLAAITLLAVESSLIVALLLERRRRRAVERGLRHLSGRLITAQEEERSRIARDLHDDLSQRLGMLGIGIEQVRAKLPAGAAELRTRMTELWEAADGASGAMHDIAYRLHPSKLRNLGLAAAIESLCRDVEQRRDVRIELRVQDVPTDLDDDLSLCVYRVVQEALNNVVKHSEASAAQVELARDGQVLRVSIVDSGKGFIVRTDGGQVGLGLASMQERLNLVHGSLVIDSAPQHGTRVAMSVPLPAPSPS